VAEQSCGGQSRSIKALTTPEFWHGYGALRTGSSRISTSSNAALFEAWSMSIPTKRPSAPKAGMTSGTASHHI
jgi:hypothetical protein